MRRALSAGLLAVGLALPLPASAQSGRLPDKLPLRGNFQVRTGVASLDRPALKKLFPMFQDAGFDIDGAHLDFIGLTDPSKAMTAELWQVYRGAAARYATLRANLTPIPGFTWAEQNLSIAVFGSDHPVSGSFSQDWPALRTGRLITQSTSIPVPNGCGSYMRPTIALPSPHYIFYTALDMPINYGGPTTTGNTNQGLAQGESDLPFGPPSSNNPWPLDTIWGRETGLSATDLNPPRGCLDLARTEQKSGVEAIAAMEEELASTHSTGDSSTLDRLQGRLVTGIGAPGVAHLPLPPGFKSDEQLLNPTTTNEDYAQAYAQYYAMLWEGITLFQDYGQTGSRRIDQVSGQTDLKNSLESARAAWLQGHTDQMRDQSQYSFSSREMFFNWLDRYDPGAHLVGQFQDVAKTAIAPLLDALDPQIPAAQSRLRDRMALITVASGHTGEESGASGSSGSGPYPTGSPAPTGGPYPTGTSGAAGAANGYLGVSQGRHGYNLALRNGWRVAPSSGVDNEGLLSARAGQSLPRARTSFTGLYPGDARSIAAGHATLSLSSQAGPRMLQILGAVEQRRTFVSEDANLDLLFYANRLDADGSVVSTTLMGDDFYGQNTPTDQLVEFGVQVNLQRSQGSGRVLDNAMVKLVAVSEEERSGQSTLRIKPRSAQESRITSLNQATLMVADETPMVDLYSALSSRKRGVAAMLENYGYGPDPQPTPAPNPNARNLALNLTRRMTVHPHQPGGIMAYYALVRLPSATCPRETAGRRCLEECDHHSYLISAPIWVVGDWSRYVPFDQTR